MATSKTTAAKTTAAKTTAAKKPATSAVTIKKPSSMAVADIQAALKAQVEANASRVELGGGRTIRVGQDKSFTLPDGTKTREALDLVVVDFVSINKYYENTYNKDDLAPPNCIAIHPKPRGMVPLAVSPDKQCDECDSCPQNQFWSSTTGGAKACKNTRLLAVLPPDATDETDIWLLGVSPTAIKNFDKFVASTSRTYQLPPVGVVVTVGFSESKNYPCLEFTNPEPNENVGHHLLRQAEARELLNQAPDMSSFGETKAKAKAKAPQRHAAPTARRTAAAR